MGYWIAMYSLDHADRWIVAGWAFGGEVPRHTIARDRLRRGCRLFGKNYHFPDI
jgi:hypothetical protein